MTAPYFEDDTGERIARDHEGNNYYIPTKITYKEWKKQQDSGIIKASKIPFAPAASIKEAETYARDVLGIPNASYKGCDLDTANAWNEGLKDTFERFPELRNNFGFVGEAHERNVAIKPIVQRQYFAELQKLNPGFTSEQLNPYADQKAAAYMRKMSIGKNCFAQSWSPTSMELKPFAGVSVNREWGKNSDTFIKALKRNVQTQFHPIGCDNIRSVLDHEIGHQLDDWFQVSKEPNIRALYDQRTNIQITDDLSRYAWNNKNSNSYSEMVAEGWAEYCNNQNPREMAQEVGKTIERLYGQWKKKNS